ncbi:MAG: IS3 family transposase [Planctomycetota bacterium]
MPVRKSLEHLGISPSTYYRWKREEPFSGRRRSEPMKPQQVFEALPEEKQAVRKYALEHPEIRHRELCWRMLDDDIVALSSSSVYRILREQDLMQRQRGRAKRYREELEKASRPDEIWGTDLMYLKVGGQQYYLIAFIDEYSRYLVHWELLASMDASAVSLAAQKAIEGLPRDSEGKLLSSPVIRSDNGSGYISQEFGSLLAFHGLTHHRIRPHCPEENGVMERANRTLRESLEDLEASNRYEAEEAIRKIVEHYNLHRLHSALGFKAPIVYYRGNPAEIETKRREKLRAARHRRKERNLQIRQSTLFLDTPQSTT